MELNSLEEGMKQVEVAEPYRFNFEIAWEVANKGESECGDGREVV